MSAPNQFNDYRNYDFYFKKFDDLEDFKGEGKKAVEDFTASGKPLGQFSYRVGSSNFNPSSVKTDYNTAEKGEFIDYIERADLDKAIESFDAILGEIEMGGEVKKSKLKITDDKRGIFDFSLASKGLFRVVEFYSEELKNELPDEFPKFPQGIADPNLVKKNALGQFVYVSPTNNKSYFLKRRQKGTTEILNLKPDALLKTTDNGIEHTVLNSYEEVKLEYKSSIKKTYLMFEKKGGKARYVDLYVVVGGLQKLEPIGMLNRTLPVLLASKILEENGIKTRIYGTRMYQRINYDTGNAYDAYVTYTFKLKDYNQDIDFNWLAINVADPRFFRWNLFKYTSAMLQLQGLDDRGSGKTVYGGNELNEVFGRYKNWYFAEMEAGREPENQIDKRLMLSGGLSSPSNSIQQEDIKKEFFRIIDVVDFQFNKPEKAVQKIYNRFEKEYPQYNKDQIKNMTSNYVIRILSDAYAFPVGGKYATPQKEQDELTQSLEDAITAMENYFDNL
jgi:hypothetical protein